VRLRKHVVLLVIVLKQLHEVSQDLLDFRWQWLASWFWHADLANLRERCFLFYQLQLWLDSHMEEFLASVVGCFDSDWCGVIASAGSGTGLGLAADAAS
jgi:hypothetical protein